MAFTVTILGYSVFTRDYLATTFTFSPSGDKRLSEDVIVRKGIASPVILLLHSIHYSVGTINNGWTIQ